MLSRLVCQIRQHGSQELAKEQYQEKQKKETAEANREFQRQAAEAARRHNESCESGINSCQRKALPASKRGGQRRPDKRREKRMPERPTPKEEPAGEPFDGRRFLIGLALVVLIVVALYSRFKDEISNRQRQMSSLL